MGIGSLSPYAQPQSGAPSWKTGEREAACVFPSLTIFIILAFKFKIEFAVLNQLMAVATQGSRTASNRKKGATFEQRRYRRPGTTLMLKGYSDDDIGGVRLPFISTTNEGNQQKPHQNHQEPPSMTEIPKPTLTHLSPKPPKSVNSSTTPTSPSPPAPVSNSAPPPTPPADTAKPSSPTPFAPKTATTPS